jgi:hypothetical protein
MRETNARFLRRETLLQNWLLKTALLSVHCKGECHTLSLRARCANEKPEERILPWYYNYLVRIYYSNFLNTV